LSTALATIERDAALRWGESILIVGCGGLGTNLIRAAKMMHAHPIVVTDTFDKEASAKGIGATEFFNFKDIEAYAKRQFDVIIDTAGTGGSMEETLPLLAPSGRYIMVGHPHPGKGVTMFDADHMFGGDGKTIKATQGGGFRPDLDIPRFVALHKQGILNIGGIISHRISLDQINDGVELVKSGLASRVLIDMSL
jgi:Zn-dependent alcohol dehydrogenase